MSAMIDITFLLLVFFLLGMRFKEPQARLSACLPTHGGACLYGSKLPDIEELVIRVRMEKGHKLPCYQVGEMKFNGAGSFEQLEQMLYRGYSIGGDRPVMIDPDADAPYERVLCVLDSCMEIGYRSIAFAASKPEGL